MSRHGLRCRAYFDLPKADFPLPGCQSVSVFHADSSRLRILSASLRSVTSSSAEAGLQTVDQVADDGKDKEEDDDDDRNDNVAGHGCGWALVVCGEMESWWVGRLGKADEASEVRLKS